MKRIPAILALVAFVGAAFLVYLTKPSDEELQRPFVTYAGFGEQVEGRDLTWTAEDAYLADRLTSSEWIGETDGVWLVIEGTIGSKLGITSPDVSVLIGDLRYVASDRPGDAALGESLSAGLPQAGAFAFELPRSVLDEPGRHARHGAVRDRIPGAPRLRDRHGARPHAARPPHHGRAPASRGW